MTESQVPKRDIALLASILRTLSPPGSIGDQAADVLLEQAREIEFLRRAIVYGRQGRFAGYFTELRSAMSYRLWEQGGPEPQGDDVALYEA